MDYYEILGVKPNATAPEIKKAYLKQVKKHHPDHSKEKDAEETFKIIAKAYSTLKDPVNRQVYDLGKVSPEFDPDQDGGMTSSSSSYSKYYGSNPEELRKRNEKYTKKWDPRTHKQETTKDEYQNLREKMSEVKFYETGVFKVGLVLSLILAYDTYTRVQLNKHQKFVDTQREIINQNYYENPLFLIKKSDSKQNINSNNIKEQQRDLSELKVPNQRINSEKQPQIHVNDYINERRQEVEDEQNEYHGVY